MKSANRRVDERSWFAISCRLSILLSILATLGAAAPVQAQVEIQPLPIPSNVQPPTYAELISELQKQKARIDALEEAASSAEEEDDEDCPSVSDDKCEGGCKWKWNCGRRPGEITFKPGVRIQPRYLYNNLNNDNDFFIRRFRLKGSGTIYDMATYGTELKVDSTKVFGGRFDPIPVVENAWVDFPICKDVFLHVGLYDLPFSRNALTSDSKLLFMDRSLIKAELTAEGLADNTIGLMLHGRPFGGYFEYSVGVFDNARFELLNEFGLGELANESDKLMTAGRCVVYLLDPAPQSSGVVVPANGYADYKGSYIGEGQRLAIGANYAYLGDVREEALGPDRFDLYAWGADILFNTGPWVFQAEYDWFRQARHGGLGDLTGEGWYAQAGYLLGCIGKGAYEIAGRYQELRPDDTDEKLKWTSIGLNIYIHEHNLKIQTDYTFRDETLIKLDNDVFQTQLQLDF